MRRIASIAALSVLAACGEAGAPEAGSETAANAGAAIHPEIWPELALPAADPAIEARVEELLARMTLEEKVGQIIQAELQSVTPEDVRTYHLGSVLNGGGSAPNGDMRSAPADWLAMADAFWAASTDTSDGGAGVPVIWGTDAVHGHNAAFGATIFPHNIGLGAANDPDLMRRIGAVAAAETRVTGHDWTFGPTVAVPRDDRWGRSYEGFSEDAAIVASLAGPYVEGMQGAPGGADWLGGAHIIATAKHFLGDGGTDRGVDQGDNLSSEEELRDMHGAGYVTALEAGAQTVMASYSSWHGRKMHGHAELLTDVLKDRMGFDGFVVGDWNGHGQIPGCRPDDCPQAINAGIDMFMVPQDWKALYDNTLAQMRDGTIPMARLDDAVRRILRVKLRAGLFEAPRPSERAGADGALGSAEHRAVAREAARKSLVLLKNNNDVLPLRPGARVLVAGPGADDIGMQSGGWTLSWQGGADHNEDFPGATSIWAGIRDAVEAEGGTAMLSEDGAYDARPDVAIVVYGEAPYAEGVGDRDTVAYSPGDDSDLELLQRLKAEGIPVVSVFLSGRPLWVNRHINASDAFVAAFLPGSEGGGVADVLTGAADFTGRLSFSWPATAVQTPLNPDEAEYDPLFALGYGLSYAQGAEVAQLSEDAGVDLSSLDSRTVYLSERGTLRPWRLTMTPEAGTLAEADGVRTLTWNGGAEATASLTSFTPVDLTRETNAVMTLTAQLHVAAPLDAGPVTMAMAGPGGEARFDVTDRVAVATFGDGVTLRIPLACFANAGLDMDAITTPFALTAAAPLSVELRDVRLTERAAGDECPPAER